MCPLLSINCWMNISIDGACLTNDMVYKALVNFHKEENFYFGSTQNIP